MKNPREDIVFLIDSKCYISLDDCIEIVFSEKGGKITISELHTKIFRTFNLR